MNRLLGKRCNAGILIGGHLDLDGPEGTGLVISTLPESFGFHILQYGQQGFTEFGEVPEPLERFHRGRLDEKLVQPVRQSGNLFGQGDSGLYRIAGDQLPGDQGEGIDVRFLEVHGGIRQLLGPPVVVLDGDLLAFDQTGCQEVIGVGKGQSVGKNEYVLGLQVAVVGAGGMDDLQAGGNAGHDGANLLDGEVLTAFGMQIQDGSEGHPLHQLAGDELQPLVFHDLVDLDQIGVLVGTGPVESQLVLFFEFRDEQFRLEDLHGNRKIQGEVQGLVDDTDGARSPPVNDPEPSAEFVADSWESVRRIHASPPLWESDSKERMDVSRWIV